MNQTTQALEHASVRPYCKVLRMPVIGSNFVRLSEQAIKEQRSHIGYLEALLTMEAEERDRHAIQKRIRDAKLPRQKNAVKRVLVRWLRYDVIVLDEVGYVPLAEIGAEFLFQVIAERAERAALIVTTNLPFSEWTQVFSNPRLCKALLDRITDRAHIIETGTESYRFRRTLEVRQKKKVS